MDLSGDQFLKMPGGWRPSGRDFAPFASPVGVVYRVDSKQDASSLYMVSRPLVYVPCSCPLSL